MKMSELVEELSAKVHFLFYNKNIARIILSFLVIVVALFFITLIYISSSNSGFFNYLSKVSIISYLPYIFLHFVMAIFFFSIIDRLVADNPFNIFMKIFIIALLPRLIMTSYYTYIPSSDFASYYNMGLNMAAHNFIKVNAAISNYGIPYFAGIAIFNGIIATVFSGSMIGFQIAQSIVTSLICGFIFLIGSTYEKKVGIIAALIFAFYPGNIIATQITTNQHGAVLFALTSIFLLLKATGSDAQNMQQHLHNSAGKQSSKGGAVLKMLFAKFQVYLLIIVSGILLVFSHYMHPSAQITILAVVAWFATLCIRQIRKNKIQFFTYLKYVIVWLLTVFIVMSSLLSLFKMTKLVPEKMHQITMLAKIVVGLNLQTNGGYSEADYTDIGNQPEEKQAEYALTLIKKRTSDINVVIKLIITKVIYMWTSQENDFYSLGLSAKLESMDPNDSSYKALQYENNRVNAFMKKLNNFNKMYLSIMYMLAFLGIFAWLYSKNKNRYKIDLLMWVLCGWIGIHLLIEVQPRYRYYGMPFVFILAAMAINHILFAFKHWLKKNN